ncbi:PWWP domain-containing DNA repair factor 3 [Sarotherodon galilaeus]
MSSMEETYTSRRAWISKDSPTAAEIFSEYPRFLDMPSLFGKLTGGKTDLFLRKWEASIIPKLKSVAALETRMSSLLKDFEEKTEDEACYTALVVLTHLFPPVGASHCSLKSAITHLVDFALVCIHVCNLSYPAPLGSVFTFFEFVYDLPLSTQRKTKVLELIAQIKACK